MVGAIPGGLFELTFAVWLIARGVRTHRDRTLAREHLTDVSAPPAAKSVWTIFAIPVEIPDDGVPSIGHTEATGRRLTSRSLVRDLCFDPAMSNGGADAWANA
jgi:hypothetical protein